VNLSKVEDKEKLKLVVHYCTFAETSSLSGTFHHRRPALRIAHTIPKFGFPASFGHCYTMARKLPWEIAEAAKHARTTKSSVPSKRKSPTAYNDNLSDSDSAPIHKEKKRTRRFLSCDQSL
jgi:hypothetical protein